MKNNITLILLFIYSSFFVNAQHNEPAFTEGELFKFKIQYLAFNASNASLEVKKEQFKGKPVYHIIGEGKSSAFLSLFFKIRDRYETYIDSETLLPKRFVRDINEGGYKKNIVIDFDQKNRKALVVDHKRNTKNTFDIKPNVQDMISSFYYLRSKIDISTLKEGDEKTVPMFFDNENYNFKLRFLGKETIRTKFGKRTCLKFRPIVMADRVFKEKESLTIWISNDKNKIPMRISADLAVGALTANLSEYKGLKYPF